VLERGQTWLGRAFVVSQWYVSGYLPLADRAGQRVGMLYVGFLEQPFTLLRWGMLGVAAAGPAMNLLLAFIAALAAHGAAWLGSDSAAMVYRGIALFMVVNLVLAVFNMLPIPPLDGGRILTALLPWRLAVPFARIEPAGLFIVLGVLFLAPAVIPGFRPTDWGLANIVAPLFNLVLRAAGHPV
jgi:Zn-dependent protease